MRAPRLRAELLAGAAGAEHVALRVGADQLVWETAPSRRLRCCTASTGWPRTSPRAGPTLLIVDDLHWADEPSLRWLVYLTRRLEGLPLLLLVGTRPACAGRPSSARRRAACRSHRRGDSARQPGRGVHRSVSRERLGRSPIRCSLPRCREAQAATHSFCVALLDALSRRGGHADRRSGSSRARARTGRDLAWDRGSPRAPSGRSDGAVACRRDPW